MNKKLIAIALVLVLAVSGAFAVTFPNVVTATLNATKGDFFYHGFGQPLTNTLSINDAFATVPPTIDYGYSTNVGGATIRFSITNFISGSNLVKIKSISATGGGSNLVWDDTNSAYKLFVIAPTTTYTKQLAQITVVAARGGDTLDHRGEVIAASQTVEGAASGDYTATLTFSVAAS